MEVSAADGGIGMDAARFLARIEADRRYEGQIVHVEDVPAREPRFAEPASPLCAPLRDALKSLGIGALWQHQATCLDEARTGRHVAVVTGTASGKTLAYTLPVLEKALAEPDAATLFLYPTKALAQDQLRGLVRLAQ